MLVRRDCIHHILARCWPVEFGGDNLEQSCHWHTPCTCMSRNCRLNQVGKSGRCSRQLAKGPSCCLNSRTSFTLAAATGVRSTAGAITRLLLTPARPAWTSTDGQWLGDLTNSSLQFSTEVTLVRIFFVVDKIGQKERVHAVIVSRGGTLVVIMCAGKNKIRKGDYDRKVAKEHGNGVCRKDVN